MGGCFIRILSMTPRSEKFAAIQGKITITSQDSMILGLRMASYVGGMRDSRCQASASSSGENFAAKVSVH